MYWRGAAAFVLGASNIARAAAQVITITQYPSTCSAIYTSGTRSVTVVQSTVTVSPVPWNDNSANTGTAFVLQALPDNTGSTPGAPRWILPNGYLTTDGSQAAQYVIRNGQLTLQSGGSILTYEGIPFATFASSTTVGNLNTTFRIENGQLVWSNPAFTDGQAVLYQTQDSRQNSPRIVAIFYGTAPNGDYIRIRLVARPINAATEGTLPLPGMSSTAIMSSIGGGMSSMQPPTSTGTGGGGGGGAESPYQTPTYSYQPTTGGQGGGNSLTTGQGSQPSDSAVQSSPVASPLPSGPTSPDGICGGDSGFVCANSACCGQYGYCGTGEAYCGVGCQPTFGQCDVASSMGMTSSVLPTSYPPGISIPSTATPPTSMAMSSSRSIPAYTVPTTGGSGEGVTSVAPDEPAPTVASCPSDDGAVITDANAQQYEIACGQDTTIGSYASQTVDDGFNECFPLCDERPDCMAFTFVGGVGGEGAGVCYFKNAMVETVAYGDRAVSAVRRMASSGGLPSAGVSSTTSTAPNYSTYTATASPIGPNFPGGPESRTSTSTSIMESGMSSMLSMSMSMSMSVSGMSTTAPTSAAPSPTQPVSPNGHCGTQNNGGSPEGYTCTGSVFGACCSLSGFCGDSAEYCLAGCQSEYGDCTPQDGNPVTETGFCGIDTGNQTCTGGIFGPCCSVYGVCGDGEDYCAPGNCDPEFGMCDEDESTSSMTMMSSSVMGMSSTTSTGMMMATTSTPASSSGMMMASSTTSSGAANPTSANECPAANGTTYTAPNGGTYVILCASIFAEESYSIIPSLSLRACINACLGELDQECVGVSFGLGLCYLKSTFETMKSDSELDSAVLISIMNPSASSSSSAMMMGSSTSSSMMMSSSPASSAAGASSTSPSSSRAASSIPSSSSQVASSTPSSNQAASSTPAFSTTRTTTTTSTTTTTTSSSPAITTTTTSTTRTTTTTTSSSATSSSAYLVLPSPTPCDFGDPPSYDEDDSYCKITLPFPIRVYTASDANVFASTNGFLSLTYGSSQYASQQFPASNIPNNTVAPFFDDLYLQASTPPRQGIFYQVQGTAVTFEWFVGRGGTAGRYYHFTVRYDSALPGVFTYRYYATGGDSDQGEFASVGAQGSEYHRSSCPPMELCVTVDSITDNVDLGNAAGQAIGSTYAYHVQSIAPGLVVVCDTNANTCVTAS